MRLIAALVLIAAITAPLSVRAQTADTANPQKVELARKLVEAAGGRRNAEDLIRQTYGSFDKIWAGNLSPDQERIGKAFYAHMQDEMLKLVPTILDDSVQVYARELTEKELTDMLAFETSESGQSIARKLPELRREIIVAEIPLIRKMLPEVLQKAMDNACDEAKCTSEQRRQVAELIAKAMVKKSS